MNKVSPGYKSPVKISGLHQSGLMPVRVFNVNDVKSLDHKVHGAIIGAGIGMPKKIAIIKEAKKLGVLLLNLKDADKFIKDYEDKLKTNKEQKLEKTKHKEEKKKALESNKEKPKQEKEESSIEKNIEEQTAAENKEEKTEAELEKERVLTKKDSGY